MEKLDKFKEMLLAQQDGLTELIGRTKNDRSASGMTVCAILESEKRMVENFILLVDLLPKQ